MTRLIIVLFGCLFFLWSAYVQAQPRFSSVQARSNFELALTLLNEADSTKASAFWPHIEPGDFYANIRRNLYYPEGIYQGHSTNFCGYAAFSVIFCREQPEKYVRILRDLYETGSAALGKLTMTPGPAVRASCGILRGKGKLAINPADELWLMSLPDHFKGYMNLDRRYQVGDENKIWAACTLGKFNDMARELGGYRISSWGSDLIRPLGRSHMAFIREQMDRGMVVLYVNSKYLHPSKFRLFILRAPTHFILLYDIREKRGVIELTYWDYGKKTFEIMTPKRLRKMTFGISRLN